LRRQLRGRGLAAVLLFIAAAFLVGCSGGVGPTSWFGLASSDGAAYLAASDQVVALSLDSGAELWRYPVDPDPQVFGPFYATPLVTGDLINVGGYEDGEISALAREGGLLDWAVETGDGILGGAASVDGAIVVGNDSGAVYLIDQESQEKRLLLQAGDAVWAPPHVDEEKGRVYVSSKDHHLYAVDLASGEQLWSFDAGGALVGTPALADGVLYIGTLTNKIYAVDADSGDELWNVETEGWVWGGPLVVDNTVYAGDLDGYLYALSAEDGSERWVFEADGGVRSTPTLSDGVLYFGTRDGYVYAISAEDGIQEWSQTVPSAIYTQAVVSDGILLVSPHGARVQLTAFDAESGAERWSYPPPEE
jgi:outer membrane protein assembly factor BamB